MTENILSFLLANNFMNVACVDDDGHPYMFSCFYAFDNKRNILLFTSSPKGTKHVPLLFKNKKVAGTILPDCMNITAISGIQFTGYVLQPTVINKESKSIIMDKYPIIENVPHECWGIKLDFIKFIDNAKGFGYKEVWNDKMIF